MLDNSFRGCPPDEPRTNLGGDEWANEWPKNSAWDFVALGKGHDVAFWTEFLRALHEVDPDMLVNIEHEDTELGRIEGLEVAAKVLKEADAALDPSGGPLFPPPTSTYPTLVIPSCPSSPPVPLPHDQRDAHLVKPPPPPSLSPLNSPAPPPPPPISPPLTSPPPPPSSSPLPPLSPPANSRGPGCGSRAIEFRSPAEQQGERTTSPTPTPSLPPPPPAGPRSGAVMAVATAMVTALLASNSPCRKSK